MRLVLLLLSCTTEDPAERSCQILELACTDLDGQVGAESDAQLRRCTNDPSEGGDQDGEWVIDRDCASEGLACFVEYFGGPEHDVGGCIPRACADDGIESCVAVGNHRCSDELDLLVCTTEAESGCPRYLPDPSCPAGACHPGDALYTGTCGE